MNLLFKPDKPPACDIKVPLPNSIGAKFAAVPSKAILPNGLLTTFLTPRTAFFTKLPKP